MRIDKLRLIVENKAVRESGFEPQRKEKRLWQQSVSDT
jgi:hypothetical protein